MYERPSLSVIKQFLKTNGFPENLPDYSSQQYWNVRYNEEEDLQSDWYVDYDALRPYVVKHVRKKDRVLEIGSGNSALLDRMSMDQFENLTGSDFARSLVVHKREDISFGRDRKKLQQRKEVNFELLDITRRSKYEDGSFDVVIQKAVLDCITIDHMGEVIKEVYRLLRNKGRLLSVSCMRPERRLKFFQGWSVAIHELPKEPLQVFKKVDVATCYYLYIASKEV